MSLTARKPQWPQKTVHRLKTRANAASAAHATAMAATAVNARANHVRTTPAKKPHTV